MNVADPLLGPPLVAATGMDSQRTIVVTAVDGYHLRAFFNTGIIDGLLDRGFLVTCLYPQANSDHVSEYRRDGLQFRSMRSGRPGPLEWLLLAMSSGVFRNLVPDQTLICYRVNTRWFRRSITAFAGKLLRSWRVFGFLDALIQRWPDRSDVKRFFDEVPCSLLLAGTPGWKYPELPYLREARRRGVRTCCQILSWDNLSMKGPFPFRPDRIMVWNEQMRDLAVRHFGMRQEQVAVTGAPQFDVYRHPLQDRSEARRHLCERTGITFTHSRRVITIAGIPMVLAPFQPELIGAVALLAGSGVWGADVAVIFRPHPQTPLDEYRIPASCAVHINAPFQYDDELDADTATRWKSSPDALTELCGTLRGSDVVITIASSMSLDAAAVDTPVINIAYDETGRFPQDLLDSYYASTHYSQVIASGAVDLVRDREALVAAVRRALDNPNAMAAGRRQLVEKICGPYAQMASACQVDLIAKTALS